MPGCHTCLVQGVTAGSLQRVHTLSCSVCVSKGRGGLLEQNNQRLAPSRGDLCDLTARVTCGNTQVTCARLQLVAMDCLPWYGNGVVGRSCRIQELPDYTNNFPTITTSQQTNKLLSKQGFLLVVSVGCCQIKSGTHDVRGVTDMSLT